MQKHHQLKTGNWKDDTNYLGNEILEHHINKTMKANNLIWLTKLDWPACSIWQTLISDFIRQTHKRTMISIFTDLSVQIQILAVSKC